MSHEHASLAHRRYRRARRRHRWSVAAGQVVVLVALLAAWQAAADLGLVSAFLTSRPTAVVETIARLAAQGQLWGHVAHTTLGTVVGFAAGTGIGVAIAAVLWWSPFLARVLEPYLVVFNAIPKVALGPLFIVWLGTNIRAVMAMGIAITVVIAVVVVFAAFQETDPARLTLLRSLGASRWQQFRLVVVPASVPAVLAALKANVGLALVGAVTGEFLAGGRGLGYLIVYGGQVFDMNLVMASLMLLVVLSTALYGAVSLAERVVRRRFAG